MKRIKKSLLVCCVVFLIATVVMVLPSCTEKSTVSDEWIVERISTLDQKVQELQNKVNTQQSLIDQQKLVIETLQVNLQNSIKQGNDNIIAQFNTFQTSVNNSINNINDQLKIIVAAINK